MKKNIWLFPLLLLWGSLTLGLWLLPAKDISEAERRPLAQKPQISVDTVFGGNFMGDFEDYMLDQFPLRDTFRRIKSLFHYNVLGQMDNNGIYMADGYAAKQEYPLNDSSVNHFLERLNYLYDKYLTDSRVYMAVVPDKGYYLAEKSGHLAMDYGKLFTRVEQGMPWAEHISLTEDLSLDSYYYTDTHWRQEYLFPAAGTLCDALGVTAPNDPDYRQLFLYRPFYGVYYGQAALPMEPEVISLMDTELLNNCTVYDHETGKTGKIYDNDKISTSKDLYDVFLSGAKSLLTIENPAAKTDRELIVFRDSFGSSMIPLLVHDYAKVTVVDIRYIRIDLLDRFVEFNGQDVLLLYSTLVINQSSAIQ